MNKKKLLSVAAIVTVIIVLAAIAAAICHTMLVNDTGDLSLQLEWALASSAKSYSLMDVLYRLAWFLYPEGKSIIGVIVLFVIAGLVVSAVFIKEWIPDFGWGASFVIAFLAYLMNPVFCAPWNHAFASGVQPAGVWHNPTYLGIKFILPLALLFLLRIFREKGAFWGNIIGLGIACTLGTAIKPNFTMCFEVTLGICALIWLVRGRGKEWWKPIGLLVSTVPSACILLYQYRVNYTGINSDSGNAIAPFFILKMYADQPFLAVVQSIAFWVFVFCFLRKTAWKEPIYRFMFWTTLTAYLEYLFLTEIGSRQVHANWSWGADLCNYGMFLLSLPLFLRYFSCALREKKKAGIVAGVAGMGLLFWHLISSAAYIGLFLWSKTAWI